MNTPYQCPACRSNRSRFAILEQVPLYVKLDPDSGQILKQYANAFELEPFHVPYQGTPRRVHCGVCGLIDDEQKFVATARTQPRVPQ
ncbi:DNA alkylation repair protein [Effusibacillus lacus]|uniref:DNA alkylation repair protein n=1 Tax=Effusibacillus lacus TaxID=1348429 RepID=A0A292YM27_9BACL|nr:DNA alkylation repair protein [Effusibacillus lacus]TCS72302.1 hypothetical protein EDD64_12255 [Effusibacillus lacus]GAX90226.1 hypothetical protein EFBL_1852 [Effusibacillus lacus]